MAPDASHANQDNPTAERQPDDSGAASARVMGEALRRLHIPIGQVFSSPTYRALQTVKYAQLGQPVTLPEFGDGGASMQADPTGSHAKWLKALADKVPTAGTNTVIITHLPNITEAFGAGAAGLADDEADPKPSCARQTPSWWHESRLKNGISLMPISDWHNHIDWSSPHAIQINHSPS